MSFSHKRLFSLLLAFCLIFLQGDAADKQPHRTICLNMIVKDESAIITRCLESMLPIIDYWVIVDTGSSDGTQAIIKEYMANKGVPGELHERPWVNFAHNRNQAIELAKGKADYAFFIDADDYLRYEPDFKLPELDKNYYYVYILRGGQKYARIHMVDLLGNWKYEGVLHEAIAPWPGQTGGTLEKVLNISTADGARSKNPDKYLEDAKILDAALKEDPTNSRYAFYLAQSYRDAARPDLALEHYEKRYAMAGWDQENFWTLLEIARCKELLGKPEDELIESYNRAFNYRSTRMEPLFYLSKIYRDKKDFDKAYIIAKMAMEMPRTQDLLFVQQWMYDYGLPLELSISAYWTEKYEECKQLSLEMLKNENLPQNVRECVERNLGFANSKILEKVCCNILKPKETASNEEKED